MERDTLKDYLGKMVRIQARIGRDEYPVYAGKIFNYDSDFVTLNPFIHIHEPFSSNWEPEAKRLAEFAAGTTNRKITISKRCIDSIQELIWL